MSSHQAAYDVLADSLTAQGIDVEQVKSAIKQHKIETPSWGYANSGTRFKAFPWPGAAVTTRQKMDDAAMVNKMTGAAPTVAIHIPWDKPEDGDYAAMRQYAEAQGVRIGAVNPNVFQDNEYRLGSLGNPDPGIQEQALDHILECCEIMRKTDSDSLSLWFADGTNFAGQDSLRERKQRFEHGLAAVYDHLPAGGRMLIEYKFFEPAFYSTDVPDWGTAYAWSLKLGEQAQVLVDLGHHAQGVNIEQIVAFLLDEDKLGGFHFNNRKYADDDLIVGSVNPYELFLIYNELVTAEQSQRRRPRRRGAQHRLYDRPGAQHRRQARPHDPVGDQLPGSLRQGAARAARRAGRGAPRRRCPARAHAAQQRLQTDVRPLLAQVREEMGAPVDPLAAYWASGYEEKIRAERGMPRLQRRLPVERLCHVVTTSVVPPPND